MPIAKIQLEDGRVARFEVPEGTTPDQVMAFARDQLPKGETSPTRGGFSDATDTLANAFTFGIGHDMAGAARAIGPLLKGEFDKVGDAYRSGRDESIARTQGFADRNPGTAFALNTAGTLANPVMQKIMPSAEAGLLKQSVQSAGIGAGTGAVMGFENTPGDLGDRAGGAKTGAVVGGAFGAAAPAVVAGLTKGFQYATDQTVGRLPFAQQAVANRKIAEAAARDGYKTPEAIAQRLAEIGPDATIADLGPNSQALAGAVSRTPGRGKADLIGYVTQRQEGVRDANNVLSGTQSQRIQQQIDGLIPGDAQDTIKQAASQRAAQGRNYEAAKASGDLVDVAPMLSELDAEIAKSKGGIQAALKKVRGFIVDENGRPEVTIDTLHQAKMAIDDLMSSGEARNSMGRVAQAKVRDFQDKLISAIGGAGEGGALYDAGRVGTAAAWRTTDAVNSGAAFMSKAEFGRASDVKAAIDAMSPEQLDAFRQGAAQALKDKIGDLVTRADATKRIMDMPALEERIRLAFGDDRTFKRYIDALKGERQMFGTYAEVTKGSQTAPRLAADADLKRDPSALGEAAVGIAASPFSPMAWLRGAASVAGNARDRLAIPESARDRIAQLLISRDANAIRPNMEAVAMSEAARVALARALLGGSTATAATAAGR